MAKNFTVTIPVSPYIRKYAAHRYGDPIRLDNSTLLSTAIVSLLGKPNFETRVPLHDKNLQYRYYTDKLQCIGAVSIMYNLGQSISQDQAIQVNRFLEADFKERMHIYVAQNIKAVTRRCGYLGAIEQFAAHYKIEIDSDISFEGLKQMHYRYRKQHE